MSHPASDIAIACAADQRYVVPLAVMLTSAVSHLDPSRRLSIHVLDGGIAPAERDRLSAVLEAAGASLHWYRTAAPELERLPLWGRMPAMTYQRLRVPQVLPQELHKVIWLDCDLVVTADLGLLWDTALDGRDVLAAQDIVVPFASSRGGIARHAELGIPAAAKYFNAGVMVVDLDRWRAGAIASRVVEYLRRYHDDVVFWDQEALNAVLHGAWGELDPRWNVNASVCGRAYFKPRHLEPEAYLRLIADPWILHFNGNLKPWVVKGRHPWHALYFEYLDRTAWSGWRPRRTAASVLVDVYETSRLRRLLHSGEDPFLDLVRRWGLRRSRLAGLNVLVGGAGSAPTRREAPSTGDGGPGGGGGSAAYRSPGGDGA